jgi:MOSC domain-containing protein YiiM
LLVKQSAGANMPASILAIYIADRAATPRPQTAVEVEANKGVVGDRYYNGEGTFSQKLVGKRKSEITFIAKEEVDGFNASQAESLGYGAVRRNIVTQGVELKQLIGREFTIGQARFFGIEHCEPCAHLAATVNSKVIPHLVHSGLRAAILESGRIEVGAELAFDPHMQQAQLF